MTLKNNNPGVGDAGAAESYALGCIQYAANSPKTQAKNCARRRPDGDVAASIELLAEMFPHCFAVLETRRRPLKVGIHLDALVALEGVVTAAELSRTLACYTANMVYRRRLRAGAARIGLDGEPAGEVTGQQAAIAKLQLAVEVR